MGRNTKVVTITDRGTPERPNRDFNRRYLLTEMSADKAERWAIRLLMALANGHAKVPEDLAMSGLNGLNVSIPQLLVQGIRSLAFLRFEDVEPLLAEMMGCVQFMPPGMEQGVPLQAGDAAQIEEVSTRMELRYEVLQLHLNFSLADALSNSNLRASDPAASA
jgi:hypothetical protein